jgi:hypothetical protein
MAIHEILLKCYAIMGHGNTFLFPIITNNMMEAQTCEVGGTLISLEAKS